MYEFIVCYAKSIENTPVLSVEKTQKAKPYPLNFKNNPPGVLHFKAQNVLFGIKDKKVKKGDISTSSIKAVLLDDVMIKNGRNLNDFRIKSSWRYSQESLDRLIEKGCELRAAKEPFRVNLIRYETKVKPMKNMLTKESYNTSTYEDASKEMIEIFGFEVFSKPKPSGLIKFLLSSVLHSKQEALVLDFFAGSGTTAQAVHNLNQETGKKIIFILVQSSEPVKKSSKSYKKGYKNVYDICRARVGCFEKNFDHLTLC